MQKKKKTRLAEATADMDETMALSADTGERSFSPIPTDGANVATPKKKKKKSKKREKTSKAAGKVSQNQSVTHTHNC